MNKEDIKITGVNGVTNIVCAELVDHLEKIMTNLMDDPVYNQLETEKIASAIIKALVDNLQLSESDILEYLNLTKEKSS